MAGSLRITRIVFAAGPRPGAAPLDSHPGRVVVFVGPNNSGKSLALREIENWCFNQDILRSVVQSLEVDFPNDGPTAEALLRPFEVPAPPNQGTAPGAFWIGQHTFRADQPVRNFPVQLTELTNAAQTQHLGILRSWLTSSYTIRLDGRTRFSLADSKPTGDLQTTPQNHLWALFANEERRRRVREMTAEAFGLHFVVDPTAMQQFRIRMSSRAPANSAEEQSLDQSARNFHRAAQTIDRFSDGVQAFVGLVAAVLSLPHKIILIDEPEAFLHPTLARRLGANLATLTTQRDASLIVSTHSADFLMGCVGATNDTSVVRLTYENGQASARTLPSADLSSLMKNPLLRSTGVLDALFHRAVVVSEADSDRAFYDEINRRLNVVNRGIRDSLFLNAHEKQTTHKLVAPLRRIGIPAAAIVDLDYLKDTGPNWDNLVDACQVDPARRAHLAAERTHLAGVFQGLAAPTAGGEAIKKQGIAALGPADKPRAEALITELATYGLFLVPVGELESWLKALGVQNHGPPWLIAMFQRLGESGTADYVVPGQDDVWEFVDRIRAWGDDPARLGT